MSNNYGTVQPSWSQKSGVKYEKQELVNGLAARIKELEGKQEKEDDSASKEVIAKNIAYLNRVIKEQCAMFNLKMPKVK